MPNDCWRWTYVSSQKVIADTPVAIILFESDLQATGVWDSELLILF